MSKNIFGPAKWILNLLRLFCPPHLTEEIEGDLIERFYVDAKESGKQMAQARLLWAVVLFFRPEILMRNRWRINATPLYLLSNYSRISFRVMSRNVTYTSINISGLVMGITGALLLFLWIRHETTFDQFHQDKDRIFVAWNRALENGQINCWSVTPRVLAPTLKQDYAGVENAISIASYGSNHLFTAGNVKVVKTTGAFTDSDFFNVLSFPLLQGNAATALRDPNSIVVPEDFARQLFGDSPALGKSLSISESGYSFDFTVTGVLRKLPSNTQFSFEYLLPLSFFESIGEKDIYWGNNSVMTLVKVRNGEDISSLNAQVKDIIRKHYDKGQHIDLFLYPLTKMRLYSRFENGIATGGRIEVMRLLALLGIFLVAIAGINFVNLSTARGQKRSREVAIRKVTGAYRTSLVIQFLTESVIIAGMAGIVGLALCYVALPHFNTLIQEQIPFTLDNSFWLVFVVCILSVGILAGSYPAFYISSFQPIKILKGITISLPRRNTVRSVLVTLQFGFALTLIVSALIVGKQIDYVQNREAGYSRSNLIHMPLSGDLSKNFLSFRQELLSKNLAVSLTKTSAPVTEYWSGTSEMKWGGKDPMDKTDVIRIYADEKLSTTIGLTVVMGRDMDLNNFPSDSTAALINESALAVMGFDNPIGETIVDGREWHIVGVVKDFVLTSPFQKIEPIVIFGAKSTEVLNEIYVKLNPALRSTDALRQLGAICQKYNPEYPFEYHFADIEYDQKFDSTKRTLQLTTVFTVVAIFIACLGLFGLAIYVIESRTKEIGIRRVMGGSVLGIAKLLSFSSLRPIVFSVILFTPLSWYAMKSWLESFAYRTTVDASIFILAGASILMIAFLTVVIQAIKAARTNPVTTLKEG